MIDYLTQHPFLAFTIWYSIGFISLVYGRHVRQYLKEGYTNIDVADIILTTIASILGPILLALITMAYIQENNLLSKNIFKFRRRVHKSDKQKY